MNAIYTFRDFMISFETSCSKINTYSHPYLPDNGRDHKTIKKSGISGQ